MKKHLIMIFINSEAPINKYAKQKIPQLTFVQKYQVGMTADNHDDHLEEKDKPFF